jgi:ATP-dependent DNA helicase RecG
VLQGGSDVKNIGFSETLTAEFKSDQNKLPDAEIIDAVVAFSNTDGGVLYLGVEDDGTITGLHDAHKDPTRLAAFIANKTIPPVAARCEIMGFATPVLKIEVPRRAVIVASSSGKILRRRIKADGRPENIPMYPYEITSRLSSLSLLDYSAQPVPNAGVADLDAVERERLRNIIRNYNGEQNLLALTDEELDKALQLVTAVDGKPTPTFAGLLLIGKADRLKTLVPTAESAVQVLQGTDIRVNEAFNLPLPAAFERISEYINAWNRNVDIEIGLYRVTVPDIDHRAFREALVNAYCHRDYSMLGRVRVMLDDEGLTVSNPGGFIEGVDIHGLPDAEPHGRNPVLADALKRIGLAERTGRGIDRILEGSLLYGRLLPDYSASTANSVRLFIPKGMPDEAFVRMRAEEQQRTGRPLSIHALLVLNALKHFHRASALDVAKDANIGETKTKVVIESLVEAGLVESEGTGKRAYYRLSESVYRDAGGGGGYAKPSNADKWGYSGLMLREDVQEYGYTPHDKQGYPDLVLDLAKTQGSVTRGAVVDLLRVTPPQAYRILEKLADTHKLRLDGKGRYAKYVPV